MGHQSNVHDFLHRGCRQLAKSRLSHCHNILMIAENRQRMGGDCPGRDMQHAGKKFP